MKVFQENGRNKIFFRLQKFLFDKNGRVFKKFPAFFHFSVVESNYFLDFFWFISSHQFPKDIALNFWRIIIPFEKIYVF